MADVVEIYLCKKGQKIEEGQLIMSHDINCKEAAKEDAERRCKISPTLEKIVYYDVGGGGFKVLFSYTNPNVKDAVQNRPRRTNGKAPIKKKKAPPKKVGLWQKIKKSFSG